MSRRLKAVPLALAVAALLALSIFAPSCGSSGSAQVRFVHAIQDGAAMDVYVNGTDEFPDISFLGVLPNQPGYTNVTAGTDTLEGFLTGTHTVGFNPTSVGWSSSTSYTVIGTGFVANGNNATILSIQDNNTPPAAGYIEFRVIHASPSGPGNVDIYIELNPSTGPEAPVTIAGLAYTQASKYITVAFNPNNEPIPPGYTIYVCASGNSTPIFSQTVVPNTSGAIRTLVLTDVQNGTSMRPSFLELNDAD
jgi:Domain of unknown function (DUF4397)